MRSAPARLRGRDRGRHVGLGEFLRATGSVTDVALSTTLSGDAVLGVVDVVRLELIAGATTDAQVAALAALLARATALPASSPGDHEHAAMLYRAARRSVQPVRSLSDCLVAAGGAAPRGPGAGTGPGLRDTGQRVGPAPGVTTAPRRRAGLDVRVIPAGGGLSRAIRSDRSRPQRLPGTRTRSRRPATCRCRGRRRSQPSRRCWRPLAGRSSARTPRPHGS